MSTNFTDGRPTSEFTSGVFQSAISRHLFDALLVGYDPHLFLLRQCKLKLLFLLLFPPLLFPPFSVFPYHKRLFKSFQGSLHRVRVDLKIRSPDLLKEKAKAMSKPFPNQGKPLTWKEIIEVTGRTIDEMKDMVATISNELGGTKIQECPSKQCIIADVDVDDDEILGLKSMNDEKKTQDDVKDLDNVYNHVENFLERRLRQASRDHTIVKGITRIAMPDDKNDWSRERRMGSAGGSSYLDGEEDAIQSAHQNDVFGNITNNIYDKRTEVTEKALYDGQNYQQFIVIPAICAIDNKTGYISMEQEQSKGRNSCPTEIKVTVSPWYAEDLAVSENLTYSLSTEVLEKTLMCSEYNATVRSVKLKY